MVSCAFFRAPPTATHHCSSCLFMNSDIVHFSFLPEAARETSKMKLGNYVLLNTFRTGVLLPGANIFINLFCGRH
jgi:hypothetical protein